MSVSVEFVELDTATKEEQRRKVTLPSYFFCSLDFFSVHPHNSSSFSLSLSLLSSLDLQPNKQHPQPGGTPYQTDITPITLIRKQISFFSYSTQTYHIQQNAVGVWRITGGPAHRADQPHRENTLHRLGNYLFPTFSLFIPLFVCVSINRTVQRKDNPDAPKEG